MHFKQDFFGGPIILLKIGGIPMAERTPKGLSGNDMSYIGAHYAAALIAKGIPKENIRKYGFAFCGKNVCIGKGIT